jgi:hypothetical protein
MINKHYKVLITLPDLAAAHAEQEVNIEARTWAMAVKLACEEVSRRPRVLGKHIKSAKISFTVMDSSEEANTETKHQHQESANDNQGFLFDL